MDVAHYQCRQILKECFHRINPLLKMDGEVGGIDLDDADKIEDLLKIAESATLKDDDLSITVATTDWLKKYFSTLPSQELHFYERKEALALPLAA